MSALRFVRGLRNTAIAIALLFVVVSLLLGFVLHSEKATGFAIQRALDAAPATLTVERTTGTLANGLTLYNLHFENDSADVRIARLELSVALLPLFGAQLDVERIAMIETRIRPKPADPPAQPAPLSVPTLRAPLPIRVASLSATNTTLLGESDRIIDQIDATLSWQDTQIELGALAVRAADWSVNADGAITLDENVPLAMNINWQLPAQNVAGQAAITGTLDALDVTHTLTGAYSLHSQGRVQALGRVLPAASMTHTCADNCGAPGVTLRNLTLTHDGQIDESVITLEANVANERLPPTDVRLRGTSTLSELHIESVDAKGAALNIGATGRVQWSPAVDADLQATIQSVDMRLVHASMRGNVAGSARLSGSGPEQFAVNVSQLDGQLNGYALNATAQVSRRGELFTVQPVDLRIGDNALEIAGQVRGETLDLSLAANMPQLDQIMASLAGGLEASGAITGTLEQPVAEMQFDGAQLRYAQASLEQVRGTLGITANGQVSGNVDITALSVGERELGQSQLTLGGTRDAVEADVTWEMPGSTFTMALITTPVDQGANVRVVNAGARNDVIGEWTLDETFEVTIRDSALTVAAHRWSSADAFIQVSHAQFAGNDATINAQLAQMPLQTFESFLPPGLKLDGTVYAVVALHSDAGKWAGDINWVQRDTVLRVDEGSRKRRLALQTVNLSTRIDGDAANCNITVAGDHELSLLGAVGLGDLRSDAGPSMDGSLTIQMPELTWLGPWIDGVSELAGSVALELKAAGTTSAPTLQGTFALDNGAVSLEDAGIRLEDLQLRGEGRETGALALTGRAQSGGGQLRFDGEVTRAWSADRSLNLAIRGSDVQAFNSSDYRVWLSPDLTLKVDTNGAIIGGRVDVPRANIRIADVPPDVVRPSDDIKVEGREARQGFELPVAGTVTLALGDDVHLYALGLDTDLRGNLDLVVAREKKPRFAGRVYLENGKFEAYGQKLTVDRGNVFYAGAIDNPTLDFRATRTIDDVGRQIVAGVRVTGSAQNPAIDIFAEPAVSQTDALSYLLTGRPASEASGSDGEALSQAAVAIGMARTTPLTSQLAAGLGLDELSVGGDSLDAAELVAGKQINDRLYIRYTYGVFSNLGAILLRYRLSRRIALEAGSDDAQFLDVLYTIEK